MNSNDCSVNNLIALSSSLAILIGNEFDTDEWSGDDSVDIQYDDSSDNENYLDADDDYSYQTEDSSEKYDARSSDELADLQ